MFSFTWNFTGSIHLDLAKRVQASINWQVKLPLSFFYNLLSWSSKVLDIPTNYSVVLYCALWIQQSVLCNTVYWKCNNIASFGMWKYIYTLGFTLFTGNSVSIKKLFNFHHNTKIAPWCTSLPPSHPIDKRKTGPLFLLMAISVAYARWSWGPT